jgi:hypothetical protein
MQDVPCYVYVFRNYDVGMQHRLHVSGNTWLFIIYHVSLQIKYYFHVYFRFMWISFVTSHMFFHFKLQLLNAALLKFFFYFMSGLC